MNPHRSSRQVAIALILLMLIGVGLRAAFALRSPVSYDEVFVMGIGLDEATDSGQAWLADVPLNRSNAITPLWWWVQSLPALLAGRLSLWGLRIVPLLLGGGTILLAYCCAARRVGRSAALIFAGLVAVSDVLAFTNSRGEYSESLLLLLTIPWLCRIGDARGTLQKGLLGSLLLMTHLGKGMFLVTGLALADVIAMCLFRRRRAAFLRLGLAILAAAVPVLVWIVVAVVLQPGSDEVVAPDVSAMIRSLTVGYSTGHSHMIAEPLDALQIWLDGWVWPVSAATFLALLVGCSAAMGPGRRRVLALSLLPWIGAGVCLIVGRGMIGARFHLLYLPALWFVAAIGLARLRHAHRGSLGLGGVVLFIWMVLVFCWRDFGNRDWQLDWSGAAVALLAAVACSLWWRRDRRGSAVRLGAALAVLSVVLFCLGPMRWVPFTRMEPFAHSEELAAIDAYRSGKKKLPGDHGRTLYIDLANYYLKQTDAEGHNFEPAEKYAQLEVDRDARDPRAWFYLGLARKKCGRPVESVRAAWEESYRLRPNPGLRGRLNDLP